MRNAFKVIALTSLLLLVVSCDNVKNQGEKGLNNGQPAAAVSPSNDDNAADMAQLPQTAQEYIDKYLPGSELVRVMADDDDVKAWLRNGVVLEFDLDGNIREIECMSGIPASVIDQRIINDVKSIEPKASIIKIDKNGYGDFEVKLSNGLEINYDANCRRVGYDD